MKHAGLYFYRNIAAIVMVAALLILAGCTNTTSTTTAASIPASGTTPAVTSTSVVTTTTSPGTVPPEIVQYARDWPLPGRDYANTRATTDSPINSSNVAQLGAAWIHNIPSGQSTFGSISTTPIIMGNTVYIQDIGNNVFALDLATGQQKWQTVYNLSNLGPNGASVGYGKVFISAGPYEIAAVDAATGKEIWRTTLVDFAKDPTQGVNGIDMQTTVYDGLVYVSTVPGNAGVFYAGGGMGILYALDQQTGKIVWSFNTVYPTDWVTSKPGINSGGGCWYPPAIDTQTGQSYWAIANPAPFPGQPQSATNPQAYPSGSSRPGPNLYTNSMMALDHATGKMSWYNQVWPHDISDYDLMIPPILGSANYGGKQQDIVIGAGKMGRVYAFNRQTGSMLWTTLVGDHNGNDQNATWPVDGKITVLPGILGGVETPMAYADGVVYVQANNLATDYTNGLTLALHPFSENTANMVAIDVNTGHVLWDVKLPSGGYGGATVVNDLVFTGTFDGMLYAFKRDTGQQVWSYQSPAAVNAWPAVAGDTLVWPLAGAGIPSVIGFKLGSTAPTIRFDSPLDGASIPAGDVTVTAETANFKLVDQLGKPNSAGQGHIHYFLDADAPTTQGQPAVTAPGTYAATANTTYTWNNVPAGKHTLSIELINNDHTPLNPPVVQKITVTVDSNPRLKIAQPSNGAIKKAGPITITVNVSNFNVVDKQGSANAPVEGHVHFYMDVQPPADPGKAAIPASGVWAHVSGTTYTFENVPTGLHTFYVQLVNNDHTPLTTNVTDSIQMYVIQYSGGLGGQ
jgi:outer membrane protein assembly factor BamB